MSVVLKEVRDQKIELKIFFEKFAQKIVRRFLGELEKNLENEVLFVGCGSSYNLAFIVSQYFERILNLRSKAIPAGEIAFNKAPKIRDRGIAFLFSRTGNTTEVLLAKEILKSKGYTTIGVTIEKSSRIAKESDIPLVFPVEESAIVMTKSFNLILLTLMVAADELVGNSLELYKELVDYTEDFFDLAEKVVKDLSVQKYEHFVFLGMAEFFGVGLESALKCIEMSTTFSEAYSTLEYRHGPKALVGEKTLIFIHKVEDMNEQEKKLKEELKTLGATVVEIGESGDIPISNDWRSAFLRTIPSHILGYEKAIAKGLSPDNPPHLSKTVVL
ncbi:SIS domain-containing protein [Thermotoga sp. KOL6]|uniref:SIS domain-containing protein n=1 Tax=Thermotoga sp. KOL6 TaxID=126741 RepID=UPI000C78CE8E|nr:SIS domain-containing protein [Thermotoga sp. KOL6]PLV58300.1 glutamine--fructose-6-phosphate aminotransferase [Thermotoga sp. KOL6]